MLNAVLFPKGGVVTGAAPTPDTAAPAPQAAAIEAGGGPGQGPVRRAARSAPR